MKDKEFRKFTRRDAAEYCGVSIVTIDRALAKRTIGRYQVGRRIVFDKRHLDDFLTRNEYAPKPKKVSKGLLGLQR